MKNREYFQNTKGFYCNHCNKKDPHKWQTDAIIIIYKVSNASKRQLWKTVNLETFYDILNRLDSEYAVHYAAFNNKTDKDSDMQ
jgi:hypothetical protein